MILCRQERDRKTNYSIAHKHRFLHAGLIHPSNVSRVQMELFTLPWVGSLQRASPWRTKANAVAVDCRQKDAPSSWRSAASSGSVLPHVAL